MIQLVILLGALRLGLRPWGAGYHVRDPRRHDVLSVGFALAASRAGDVVGLLEGLYAFFEAEPTMAGYTLSQYAWMEDGLNEDVRQLGMVLREICLEAESTRPSPSRRPKGVQ
ncbi:hypothetical protein [Muricoccus vinaceus]|uniref:Uncharacterized protein n=1 Tax=Muricoccus vinaceus TaxID=424704 RepID=A0ABV6ITP4_9PROT